MCYKPYSLCKICTPPNCIKIKRTITSFHPLNIKSLSSHVEKQSESTDMNMIFGIIDISYLQIK